MRMKGHRYCCSGTLLCVDVEILKIRCSHLSIGEIDRRVGDLWAIFDMSYQYDTVFQLFTLNLDYQNSFGFAMTLK